MDTEAELARFARRLMECVRDPAIRECDRLAEGSVRGPSGQRWQALVSEKPAAEGLLELVPDIVDQTLFRLLHAIDGGDLPLEWRASDGSSLGLRDIGMSEMAGWLIGGEWPKCYSAERFDPHLTELRLQAEPEDG